MALTEYLPKDFEENCYKNWEKNGYFELDGNKAIQESGKNFAIMLPPPNITGSLHIGHALNHTLSDIIVRYKRMDGYRTLWQPGTDHAGIATQNVVEKQLLKEGIKKEDIGREKFLEKVWEWKAYSGDTIVSQMRRLGVSPAWSRERFTMDEGLKSAVKKAFLKLYEDGLIVRDNYMINWCTHDGALSDIEVEHTENDGFLYYIKYFFENSDDYLVVATTRPETYFGDTAVMVNPNDERYKAHIGKSLVLPLIGKSIKIIADEYVDMEFGTGVVKVTPAHDMNDYEVGKRHNLEFLTIFDEKGILNSHCGEFEGYERLEARAKIVARLEAEGFIEKIEKHINQVGRCYRCGNIVEPYITKQWFVKKEAAAKAIEKANNGETEFIPKQWKNNYDAWMRELRDWCISRQLWWGHRIPVMYCDDCDHEWGGEESEFKECPKCKSSSIRQDADVLDTWFSSALWPFSTLGWGNENDPKVNPSDMNNFYPNSLLITGFDILFFWVARMMMMGEQFLGKLPFKDVYLHALVRDEHGQKMSKSRGNVIDPIDIVERYSADSLRFALAMLAVAGRDIRLSEEKFVQARNFTNKLFNAAKYLTMNGVKPIDITKNQPKTELGRYMAAKMAEATAQIREQLDSYRFSDATISVYKYFWDDFCDFGIELSKAQKEAVGELGGVFVESLKLLHPFMPFITEYLYKELGGKSESIMISRFPKSAAADTAIIEKFELIKEAIVSVRRAKATIDLANKKIEKAYIKPNKQIDDSAKKFIANLAKCETIEFVSQKPANCAADVSENLESFIEITSEAKEALLSRLAKQKEKIEKELAKLDGMLKNEKFMANAPKELVEENTRAANELKERLAKVLAEISSLEG
jgi:valyl-tRNA synthetase